MLNIAIMFIMIAGGGTFTQKVDPEVNHELGNVKAESTVTVTTNDYLWRTGEVDPGKYNFKVANKLLSIYFSTSEDTVYLGEEEIPKSELGSDLETYMQYKMDKYWERGPKSVNYWFEIRYGSGSSAQSLSVNSDGYEPGADSSRRSFPIALTNGETAHAFLWTKSGEGIYSVSDTPTVGSP